MPNKYKNKKHCYDGIVFASQKEMRRYIELKALQDAGEISDLRTQVKYELIPHKKGENGRVIERAVNYIADFVYRLNDTNLIVVEDVKGYRRGGAYQLFSIKRKLMLHVYGIQVIEV